MERFKLIVICMVLFFGSCNSLDNKYEESSLTKEEVLAFINHYDRSWNTKNRKAIDSILTPGYIYFTSTGDVSPKDSAMYFLASSDYVLQNAKRSEIEVHIEGNIAVVGSRWQGNGIYKGHPFTDDQRCSLTILKRDDKLLLIAEHCTQIAKK